jgi:hypothetical protein
VTIEALLALLIACDAGLLGLFVTHLFKCRDIRVDLASMRVELDALYNQVGRDSYSGMRKMVHGMEGNTPMLMELDRRIDRLENGK